MHRTATAGIPPNVEHVVACKVCGLVKTFKQFLEKGCENCPFLEMKGDRQAAEDGTTGAFSGIASIVDPETGWTAKWMHLNKCVAGVYCLCIDEDLPHEIRDMLENRDINYRIRDEPFYPPDQSQL